MTLDEIDWSDYAEDCATHDTEHGRRMCEELARTPQQRTDCE